MIERIVSSPPAISSPLREAGNRETNATFQKIFRRETVKFSQHAQDRLQRDNISLNPSDIDRIQTGMDRAADKGAKESLLLMDNLAFIANVREKIVITSIPLARLKENVFTKIDSTVIL